MGSWPLGAGDPGELGLRAWVHTVSLGGQAQGFLLSFSPIEAIPINIIGLTLCFSDLLLLWLTG